MSLSETVEYFKHSCEEKLHGEFKMENGKPVCIFTLGKLCFSKHEFKMNDESISTRDVKEITVKDLKVPLIVREEYRETCMYIPDVKVKLVLDPDTRRAVLEVI